MSIFALFAIAGTGLGAFALSFVANNERLGWRWCQWITLMLVFFDSFIDTFNTNKGMEHCLSV